MGGKCFSVELFIVEVLVLNWLCATVPEQFCTGVYVIVHWHFSSTAPLLSDMCSVFRMWKMTLLYPSR